MELRTLKTFVTVAQSGSFTRAADLLDTQKAQVSRLVTQLESELGIRLIERTTRSLSLTEAGREFFERAVGILAAVDDAHRMAQQVQGYPTGSLRLTCGVEFGTLAVSHWITQYLQAFPQVRVEADYTNRLVDLVHEGFDLAIRVGPLTESYLKVRKLGALHYRLFAAPAYLQRHDAIASPAALQSHSLLVFTVGSHRQGWLLSNGTQQLRVQAEPRLRGNNSLAMRDAAVAGMGIALLPLLMAAPLEQAGALVRVLPEWSPEPVPVHAVFASSRYLAPKVRAFIDLAAAEFARTTLAATYPLA